MTREQNVRAIIETNFTGFKDEIIDVAVKNIMALSENKGEWIPISERLPEDNTKVLVTIDATYKEKVLITWYQDKEHGFLCGLVKAWQPLPEPYKAESEEMQ